MDEARTRAGAYVTLHRYVPERLALCLHEHDFVLFRSGHSIGSLLRVLRLAPALITHTAQSYACSRDRYTSSHLIAFIFNKRQKGTQKSEANYND